MNFVYVAVLALSVSLLGCKTPTALETEYSCQGQEQSLGSYLHPMPQKAISTQYPIEIDFHLGTAKVMVKTYVANIISDDGDKVLFAIDGGDNWLKGQFNRSDRALSFLTRQTLQIGQESMDTQLSGQYSCRKT